MPEIKEEIEGVKIINVSVNELLKQDFLEKIKKMDLNAVSLVLVYEKGDKQKKIIFPIVLNHQNKLEVQNKIMHLQSPDSSLLDDLVKLFKKK